MLGVLRQRYRLYRGPLLVRVLLCWFKFEWKLELQNRLRIKNPPSLGVHVKAALHTAFGIKVDEER